MTRLGAATFVFCILHFAFLSLAFPSLPKTSLTRRFAIAAADDCKAKR
jgi:hypothetical protein